VNAGAKGRRQRKVTLNTKITLARPCVYGQSEPPAHYSYSKVSRRRGYHIKVWHSVYA